MQKLSLLIIAITFIGFLILSFFYGKTMLKNQAIDGCLQTASIEKKKGDQTITTPENYWYSFCLKEKGLK